MFFRLKQTKTGQVLQLVESFRNQEDNPRQRIVLSLGNAALRKELWGFVAEEVENHFKGIQTFFPADKEVQSWAQRIIKEIEKRGWSSRSASTEKKIISVNPEEISHHSTTELGPELVALKAWEALGFAEFLANFGFNQRQIIDTSLSVMNRLLSPCSENALPSWLQTTSFEDFFGKPLRHLSEDRFYRIADLLLKNKERIEKALCQNEKNLFGLNRTVLLYDLTNTYFEGRCQKNSKAKRGHSKEKRNDASLLSVGLVLDSEGFVLRHEVFAGNTHDSSTLLSMIDKLKEEGSSSKPLVIVDSGMSSEANLEGLRAQGYDYIVVGKRSTRVAYNEKLTSSSFREITGRKGKSKVRISSFDEDNERIVLCYSESRAEKEKKIISNAEERFIKDLEKLQQRIEKGRLKKANSAQQSFGRLLERHPRVARYYKVDLKELNEKRELTWSRIDKKYEKAWEMTGSYHLRCSRKDLDDQTIWKLYMTLTRVESSFRDLKSNLGLRPVFHHREDRCDSHIFITILAYHLLQWIEYTLRQNRDTRSWPTIRRLLQTHAYTTIACPSQEGVVYHIRAPGVPDVEQMQIYGKLDIDISRLPRKQTVL